MLWTERRNALQASGGKMDPGLVLQIPRGKTNLVLKVMISWY